MEKGSWTVINAPECDDKGWFIRAEDTETGQTVRTDYSNEQEADEAYQAIIMGRFTQRS